MKTIISTLLTLITIFAALIILAPKDHPDSISTKYISRSSVFLQCNDEHEPVVTKLTNSTEIIITCEAK